MTYERRTFLKGVVASAGAVASYAGLGCTRQATAAGKSQESKFPVKKAREWTSLPEKKVRCNLCPWECEVADRERGYCGVRENRGGTYYTLVWGRACSLRPDPIEKKPLFHFLPGTKAFSIATAGCNMECKFCQNWEISQFRPEQVKARYIPPKLIAELAKRENNPTIAYTYNEPVIFYEYMYDCAREGNEEDIKSVMISNGYIKEPPLKKLCEVLAAVKIDLKAFTDKFYKEYTKGELKPVLQTLRLLRKQKKWLEIVVLLIPTLNDSPDEVKELSKWVEGELGPDVPVHFSRYYPTYKLRNIPPTPAKTLERSREIAMKAGLNYVYVGNMPGHPGESTYCPACGERIIHRYGYRILAQRVENGKCKKCGHPVPGVWG